MMNIDRIEARSAGRARKVRVAAILCVLALVGVVWLHSPPLGDASTAESAPSRISPSSESFLHQPSRDASVPSAGSVFGASPSANSDGEPTPTF